MNNMATENNSKYKDDYEEDYSSESAQEKINKILDFFNETGLEFEDYDPSHLEGLRLSDAIPEKKSYQNFIEQLIPGQRDTAKWLDVMKEI